MQSGRFGPGNSPTFTYATPASASASTAATMAAGSIGNSPVTALTGRWPLIAATVARTVSGVTAPNAPFAASFRSMMSAPCATAISASCGPVTLASIKVIAALRSPGASSRLRTSQSSVRVQDSSVSPRMSACATATLSPDLASRTKIVMLRIRFEILCTMPVIARSAPTLLARLTSQPPHDCRLLACASLATGAISVTEKRPDSARRVRSRSLTMARRA